MAKLLTFLDRILTIHPGDTVPIGRQASKAGAPAQSPSNMLFQSSVISRAHATLQLRHGDLVITDTGSLHGTSVNEERVRGTRMLKTGDMLELGMDLTKGSVFHAAIKGRVTVRDAPVTPPDERAGQQHNTKLVNGSPTPRSFGLPTSKSRERLINQTDDFSASSFSDEFDDDDFDDEDEDEIEWKEEDVDATAAQVDEVALMDEQDSHDVLADDLTNDRLDDAIQETMSPEAQPKLDFSVTLTSATTESPASASDRSLVPAVTAPAVVPREETASVKEAPTTSDQPATTCNTSAEDKVTPALVEKTVDTPAQPAAKRFVKTFKAKTKSNIASESAKSTNLEMRTANKMHDVEQLHWHKIDPHNTNKDSPRVTEVERPDFGSHVKRYTAARFAFAMTTLPALLMQFDKMDLSSHCQNILEAAISMLTLLAKESDQEQAFPASTHRSACKRLLDLLPVGNAVLTQHYQPDSPFWLLASTTADMLDSVMNLLYRQRIQDGGAESMRLPPAGKKRRFDETRTPSDASLSAVELTASPAKKAKFVASASKMRPVVVGMLLGSVLTFGALVSLG